jgi:hypothetical protein
MEVNIMPAAFKNRVQELFPYIVNISGIFDHWTYDYIDETSSPSCLLVYDYRFHNIDDALLFRLTWT